MAPAEENGQGYGSPDMLKLAKGTVLRTTGVIPSAGAAGSHGSSGAMAGGVFGAGSAVFDASRALAVLGNLSETSEAEIGAAALMDRLQGQLEELRSLRTSAAEEALVDHRTALAAREEAGEDGVRALREELEETRQRLAAAEKSLRKLRTDPPAPSDEVVTSHPLYLEEAEGRERAERRLEASERRLKWAEHAKTVLMATVEAGGRGKGGAAMAAMARELKEAEERARDASSLIAALVGVEAEREDDDGRVWRLVIPVEDEEAELEVELMEDEEEDDEDEEEGAGGTLVVRPVSGSHLLPEAMKRPFSMPVADGPRFVLALLTHLTGGDGTMHPGEEEEGASSSG